MKRKGIILAGGMGSRLYPISLAISKQLLPIFDKPMIYYPLSILMLANIREILVISTESDLPNFKKVLGDGSWCGLDIQYTIQPSPKGLADAFLCGESFIGKDPVTLILGDNIFHGHNLQGLLDSANKQTEGATLFAYRVKEPWHYGVVEFDSKNGSVLGLEEKPQKPKSSYAVTGLYFYDNKAVEYAKTLTPSARGELEITDLNKCYLKENNLSVQILGRGHAWLDTGTHEGLLEASLFVQTIEHRQGLKVSCPEEIAFRKKWITTEQLEKRINLMNKNNYGIYLKHLLETEANS